MDSPDLFMDDPDLFIWFFSCLWMIQTNLQKTSTCLFDLFSCLWMILTCVFDLFTKVPVLFMDDLDLFMKDSDMFIWFVYLFTNDPDLLEDDVWILNPLTVQKALFSVSLFWIFKISKYFEPTVRGFDLRCRSWRPSRRRQKVLKINRENLSEIAKH